MPVRYAQSSCTTASRNLANLCQSNDWRSMLLVLATFGAIGCGSASVPSATVRAVTLVSIAVTPTNPSVAAGGTQQCTATGMYSDASTQNLTANVTWASSSTATATISGGGLASALEAGSTTISATSGTVTGNTSLTVTGMSTPTNGTGTTVTDNFARPNGNLGPNWSVLSTDGGSDGGIQLLDNAFAPTSNSQTAFPTSIGTWVGPGTFGPNQYAKVQIGAIAPEQSVVAITAATSLGSSTIYSYTLTSGQPLRIPQPVIITGMGTSGNNGSFVISALDTGTFTVPNAGGVTATAQSGTGTSPTDSLCGPVVRSIAGVLNGYLVYIGNNSGYVARHNGQTDDRVYVHELWKFVNGTPSEIKQVLTSPTISDSVGDIFYLFALGEKVAFYKNNFVQAVDLDSSLTLGTPGIIASSATGAGNTMPLGMNLGVSGTQFTNWVGSDVPSTPPNWVAQATETFMVRGPAPNPPWSQVTGFTKVPAFPGTIGGNAGEAAFEGNSSLIYTGRTWANDQSSSVVLSNVTGKTSIDLLLRASSSAETFYLGQFHFPQGLGAGTFNLEKFMDGTPTILATIPGTVNFADVLRLEVVGTTINFKQNGTIILTANDSSITSGSPGITGGGNANIMFWEGDEAVP
jgi:Bacterial Ig-like domain (group 2)